MFLDNDKLLFDAAMEGAYTGYLDYPVFVSEDEVTQYARQYAQDIALETNADLTRSFKTVGLQDTCSSVNLQRKIQSLFKSKRA